MKKEFELFDSLKAMGWSDWQCLSLYTLGERNMERLNIGDYGRSEEVSIFIDKYGDNVAQPFTDESSRELVDPVTFYGEAFLDCPAVKCRVAMNLSAMNTGKAIAERGL